LRSLGRRRRSDKASRFLGLQIENTTKLLELWRQEVLVRSQKGGQAFLLRGRENKFAHLGLGGHVTKKEREAKHPVDLCFQ